MKQFKTVALFLCAIAVVAFAAYQWGAKQHDAGELQSAEGAIDEVEIARIPAGTDEGALNQIIYNATHVSKIDKMITDVIAYADTHKQSNTAQIYKSFVAPLPRLKGIIWRMRHLVEPIDAAYIFIINDLRIFKRNSERRAGYIDALFDYLADPIPGENIEGVGPATTFKSAAEFQDYMTQKIAPVVQAQLTELEKIAKTADKRQPIFIYDANLLFGLTDFASNSPVIRMRKYMVGHLEALIANIHLRMAMGYYLASYDLGGAAYFMNTLAAKTLIGKKGAFLDPKGNVTNVFNLSLQSPKEISEILKDPKLTDFLKLRAEAKPQGQNRGYLAFSLEHFKAAAGWRSAAYKEMDRLEKLGNSREYFLDPEFATARASVSPAILEKRKRMLGGANENFVDRITGKSYKINLPALFDANNPNIQDLKGFYANQFETEYNGVKGPKSSGTADTFKWNYKYGKAVAWPNPTFGGLFPEANNNRKDEKNANMHILAVSRDASLAPLTFWLRLFL